MKSLKRGNFAGDRNSGSIASKTFVRSTKNGKVSKVVRELYLRQDIPCSSKLCEICKQNAPADANGAIPSFVLSSRPAGSKAFPSGHYLLPDTNVLLNGMDLFEEANVFHDVIVLQTVLEELKNRSLPLYNRLLALTKSEGKRFYLFFNEFRQETYIGRKEGESINDRNDRAVRRAACWYAEHLPRKRCPAIVLLTDDKANIAKAKAEQILTLTLGEYISGLEDAARLLDMISDAGQGQESRAPQGEMFYPEYYTTSKLMTGIKAGTLHQGVFNVSPFNYLEGTVQVSAFEKPLLILGRETSNRSVSGDIVAVEILPMDQWKAPSTKIVDDETLNRNDNAEVEEDEAVITDYERRILQEEVKKAHVGTSETKAQPTAKVVGIVKRNWRQYVGTVDSNSAGFSVSQGRRQQIVFLMPMDKRIPKIRIRTRQAQQLVGKRILATIDSWDRGTRYPVGHYVRSLGDIETKSAETEALLLEYDVQYRPFPNAVLDCLPPEGHTWKVPSFKTDPGWKGRKDLRDLLICSIDPQGCQDIDDALHARSLPNGNFEVGVHIADVSHFVKPKNPMDAEASQRGTTVYLVDKRIDMLPTLLGTDLCSLKPNVERYAFSAIWELTPSAEIVSAGFTKSVILSRSAFSYEAAQLCIDDANDETPLTQSMRALLTLSQKLRAKRMEAGALNLASPEVRIETDSETSDPLTDVKTKAHLATNSLVEEFMLLANTTVARKIHTSFPSSALLRRHANPPASNFAALAESLQRKRGLVLDVSTSKALADSLDRCTDSQLSFFNTLVRILATRCMTSAEYFASGSHAETEFRHYGLASDIYTHFTSPIRRYADLLVHRQLAAAIDYDGEGSGLVDEGIRSKGKLEDVCANLNRRHRNAQMAGRASIEYYVGQALKSSGGKKGINTEGYIMRVFENGIVVFVPRFGIEGLVRLEDFDLGSGEGIQRDSEFDGEDYQLKVWEKGNPENQRVIELFEQVNVTISSEEKSGSREMGKRRVRIKVLS